MKVDLLYKTDNPEEAITTAARNDYMTEYVGDMSYEEVIGGASTDVQAKKQVLTSRGYDEDVIESQVLSEFPSDAQEEVKKRSLIHRLLRDGHFGPFEHPKAVFAAEGISRVCMAQLTRHRHASHDVQSLRYTAPDTEEIYRIAEDEDYEALEEYVVVPKLIRDMAADGENQDIYEAWMEEQLSSFVNYADVLETAVEEFGIARKMAKQDARFQLPMSTKVNMVFSVNARMLMHIGDMRAAANAQWEIRELTEQVLDFAEEWCPITFDYYEKNMKNRKNRLAP